MALMTTRRTAARTHRRIWLSVSDPELDRAMGPRHRLRIGARVPRVATGEEVTGSAEPSTLDLEVRVCEHCLIMRVHVFVAELLLT
jgi:hypothetical protein